MNAILDSRVQHCTGRAAVLVCRVSSHVSASCVGIARTRHIPDAVCTHARGDNGAACSRDQGLQSIVAHVGRSSCSSLLGCAHWEPNSANRLGRMQITGCARGAPPSHIADVVCEERVFGPDAMPGSAMPLLGLARGHVLDSGQLRRTCRLARYITRRTLAGAQTFPKERDVDGRSESSLSVPITISAICRL